MNRDDLIEGSIVLVSDCVATRFNGGRNTPIEINRSVKAVILLPTERSEVVISQINTDLILVDPLQLQGISISDDILLLLGFQRCEHIVNGYVYSNAFSFHDNVYVVKDNNEYYLKNQQNGTLLEISEVHFLQKKIFESMRIILSADMVNFNNLLGIRLG